MFLEKTRDWIDKIIDQFYLSKIIPNVTLKFKSWQEICKYSLVTSTHNFPMHRYISF